MLSLQESSLKYFEDTDLDIIGITIIGHRKKLLNSIKQMK